MTRRLALDIESDNLLHKATKIWVVVTQDLDTSESKVFTSSEGLQEHIDSYDEVWMHNGISFDAPILTKFSWATIPKEKMWDTLLISRMLDPDRFGGHSLASWGEEFDFPKGDFTDFSKFSPEMVTYCERDVAITSQLAHLFIPDIDKYRQAIDIDREFAYYLSLQEANGFTLDIQFAEALVKELEAEAKKLTEKLQSELPKVKDVSASYREAVKEGRIIEESAESFTYITKKNRTVKTAEFKYKKVNPNSKAQIIDYFISEYGWEPEVMTEKGSPKLDEAVLKTLTYKEVPDLLRLTFISKELGMLVRGAGSYLKVVDRETSRVHGSIMVNGANGGRCTHSKPNLANISRKDMRMRQCWVGRKGWKLVDCDAAGLELRMLAHYLAHFDKGAYAHIILGGDIHSYNQKAMRLDKRDSAKTGIYAMIYGAGDEKLGETVAADSDNPTKDSKTLKRLGKGLRNSVMEEITGYKELMELIRETATDRGHIIGIDGRPLVPRNFYSALNLLLQSGGASVMKLALNNFMRMMEAEGLEHGVDFGLCANIHDEFIVEAPEHHLGLIEVLSKKAIEMTSEQLEIAIPMAGEAQIGDNWREIH